MDDKEKSKRHRIIMGIHANAQSITHIIDKHYDAMMEKDNDKLREQRKVMPFIVAEGLDEETQIESCVAAISRSERVSDSDGGDASGRHSARDENRSCDAKRSRTDNTEIWCCRGWWYRTSLADGSFRIACHSFAKQFDCSLLRRGSCAND
jgi:hypothetical protein